MKTAINPLIEPLIRRKIFSTEEEAVREIVREYILRQITDIRKEVEHFEHKYRMRFEEFGSCLRQRSELLVSDDLPETQRLPLSRAVMEEENDWLDWKVSQEMLDCWLGISGESEIEFQFAD